MLKINNRPILVTGPIRSGTTWVGRMISASNSVAQIHEPFNKYHRLGVFNTNIKHQYTYVTDDNEYNILNALSKTLSYKYSLLSQIYDLNSIKNVSGMIRDFSRFFFWRYLSHPRPLIKDPIAIFSAEWLAKKFNIDCIVLIRHPAAFAWSYKRMNEKNRFIDLIAQKDLITDMLSPFEAEIHDFAQKKYDLIDQAILMWRIFAYTINRYQSIFSEWIYKKHEDLSIKPIEEFRQIYKYLSLEYTEKVQKTIKTFTADSNPIEAPNNIRHHLKRNSKRNIRLWQEKLTISEIKRIRKGTEDISHLFYSDETWA